MNGTILLAHHHPINEPPAIDELPSGIYDPLGAALFIVIVLLWYSMCLACMLGTQIRARSETIDDCVRRRAKLFIETLQDQTERKQILGECLSHVRTLQCRDLQRNWPMRESVIDCGKSIGARRKSTPIRCCAPRSIGSRTSESN